MHKREFLFLPGGRQQPGGGGSSRMQRTAGVVYRCRLCLQVRIYPARPWINRRKWVAAYSPRAAQFSGSSTGAASSQNSRDILADTPARRPREDVIRGCCEDDTRKLLPWNSSFSGAQTTKVYSPRCFQSLYDIAYSPSQTHVARVTIAFVLTQTAKWAADTQGRFCTSTLGGTVGDRALRRGGGHQKKKLCR